MNVVDQFASFDTFGPQIDPLFKPKSDTLSSKLALNLLYTVYGRSNRPNVTQKMSKERFHKEFTKIN